MKFSGILQTGPVTALATCDGYVIAGVGGDVTVYDSQERRKLCCRNVLPYQNIHGIRKKFDDNVFCIFGEKCFRVIRLLITDDKKLAVECCGDVSEVEDWILDVAWLKECETGSFSSLVLALSHNVVLLWDPVTSCLLQRVCCVENCILSYCALLIGTTWSGLVLAAGTVFNQVIIWSPGGDTSSEKQHDVIHTLGGHEGVIFSIDYLPSKHIIASVSDDRTIRLWSLRFPGSGKTVSDWLRVKSTPLLTLYGHSARVWDVELLDNVLVSVGEDATCLVWDYSGKILHKFRGHMGKSIWSLACDKTEKFVVTGGGDSSVRLWTLAEEGDQGDMLHQTLALPDAAQKSTRGGMKPSPRAADSAPHWQHEKTMSSCLLEAHDEDFARTVAMSDFNTVLVMTNCGCLLKHSMLSCSWTEISHDPLFSSYTVMAVSPHGKYVAIGNITGIVRVFDVSTCEETEFSKLYEGKVFGLVWVDTGHLLATGPEGDMLVLSMPCLKTRARLSLPACKQRWASAGVLCLRKGASPSALNGKAGESGTVLVCGDRGGTVHCYDIIYDSSAEPCLPISSYGKIHGKAGVTDVCFHDNRVYTSGRDGRYRQWEVTERGLHLRTTHRVMKGMDWVDRVCVSDEDTLIYGFQSSHFALWSVGENLKLVSVECGGGHRTWDCQLDAGRARFVYLKTKQILVCDTTCRSRQIILKESLHGRELCDVKHLATFRNSTGQLEHLVATCSEDTTVQLSTIYSAGPGLTDLKVEHTLQGHLSTVKTLAVSRSLSQPRSQSGGSVHQAADGNHEDEADGDGGDGSFKEPTQGVIMFSGGGRAQIQICRITLKHFHASDVKKDKMSMNKANNKIKHDVPEKSLVCNKVDQVSDDRQKDKSIFSDQKNLVHTLENRPHCSGKDSESHDLSPVSGGGEDRSNKLSPVSGVSCSYEHLGNMFLCGERTRRGSVQSDPETRVMCLTALCLRDVSRDYSQTLHILAAACSDSYLRIFGFNEDSKTLTLLQQSGYHDNCVLQVSHIISNSKVIIMSGASEGKIAFWDISQLCFLYAENVTILQTFERQNKSTRHFVKTLDTTLEMDFKPVSLVTVHQSGLNSIHCYSCGGGRHLVASGGDDNCLSVTSIFVQEAIDGSCVQIEKCVKNINAHAAQITGVWVLSPDCLVSASIDQRVCVWEIPRTDQQPFKMLGCRYVHISDISSLDVWREGFEVYMSVCGQGLSVIKLDIS